MNDRIYTIDEIKSIIAPIAEKYNLPAVFLFGSYARGEATEKSDIDLCVDASNIKGLMPLGSLYYDLEHALGKELDLITIDSLPQDHNSRFTANLSREWVQLYVGK